MKKILLFADIGGHEYQKYYHVGDEAMFYETYRWYKSNHATYKLTALSWFTTHQNLEAQLMSDYAVSLGIPRKNILLEEHSQNTFENFFYTTKLFLEPNDWKKVIIITSDYHFKRVQKTGNAFFDSDYQIKYIGAIEPAPKMKKMIRYIKETILLHTQGFFQNFFNRR